MFNLLGVTAVLQLCILFGIIALLSDIHSFGMKLTRTNLDDIDNKLESLVRFAEAYSRVHKDIAEEIHRIKAEQEMAKILREAKEKERSSGGSGAGI